MLDILIHLCNYIISGKRYNHTHYRVINMDKNIDLTVKEITMYTTHLEGTDLILTIGVEQLSDTELQDLLEGVTHEIQQRELSSSRL